jgi:hypothetical protein
MAVRPSSSKSTPRGPGQPPFFPENEDKFRLLFERSGDAILLLDGAILKKSPMPTLRLALLTLLVCLFAACSSSGGGRLNTSSAATPKVVSARVSENERGNEYMPEVLDVLRSAGFTVVAKQKTPYEVAVQFPGVSVDMNCSIVLYERGAPVVTGRSVNLGFGTWLVRGAAYRQIFSAALRQFEKRLRGA